MAPKHVARSTVFISVDGTAKVYRTPDEVPIPPSRSGWNSATILIADRRGRDEVARALYGAPAALQFRFLGSPEDQTPGETKASGFPYRRWIGALLLPASALLVWLLFASK